MLAYAGSRCSSVNNTTSSRTSDDVLVKICSRSFSNYKVVLFESYSILESQGGQFLMCVIFSLNPFTLRVPLESIVCFSHTFQNNFGIKQNITKYSMESCGLASDQHFLF